MNHRSRPVEVLIVGGGPAGSAAAFTLAKAGRDVIVVERSSYAQSRVGETLPSLANPVLTRLGINPESATFRHLRCPGTMVVWGDDSPYYNDCLFDPDGPGFHLDRASFDRELSRLAEAAGATVLTGAEVLSCRRDGQIWEVTVDVGGVRRCQQAVTLIDAGGRTPWPGRPSRRKSFDRQVAIINQFEFEPGNPAPADFRTWIESTPEGWWYSSALPDNQLIAAFFTDADLLGASRKYRSGRWAHLLSGASWTQQRLALSTAVTDSQVISASSSISLPIVASNYVAVGDAASTIDPLSSHGIVYALNTGQQAAEALLEPDVDRALARYAREIVARFRDDLRVRRKFYGAELRWPDALFWRRRL